jgi:hypothetical protein
MGCKSTIYLLPISARTRPYAVLLATESFHTGVAIQCGATIDNTQTALSLLICIMTSREIIQDGSFFHANELVTVIVKELLSI